MRIAAVLLLLGSALAPLWESQGLDPRFELVTMEAPKGVLAFAAGDGAAWLLTKDQLLKVGRRDGAPAALPLEKGKWYGSSPAAGGGDYAPPMAAGGGSVWLVGDAHGVRGIHRIDPATGSCIAAIALEKTDAEASLSFAEGALWLFNRSNRTLQRIDPKTNRVAATMEFGKGYWQSISPDEGSLWSIELEKGVVKRIDPQSNKVVEEFSAGAAQRNGFLDMSLGREGQYSLAAGEGTLWIASVRTLDVAQDRLYRIDPKTHARVSTVESIISFFGAPAFWEGLAWVRNGGYNRTGYYIAAIDPKNNAIEGEFLLPLTHKQEMPPIVRADEDSLWIYTGRMLARVQRKAQP
jgi:hypothetical protein